MVTIDTIVSVARAPIADGQATDQVIVPDRSAWTKIFAACRLWTRRRRTRVHLSELTVDQLWDVGLTPDDARQEISRSRFLSIERPFQPPF
ncbi:DUF1127 domain-containing protein [Rhizobium sp. AAP43]|uniref:DUF1127 domain-containing protein n=1 Tax=Rhizobium sp. AAP43 TaxID=1523420 RepID=UPI0006B9AC80|nr:DUF1127 domain-containing protein [Rhizobium sp. AAP43]KPF44086.1 hypothetical protein IP76_11810 [Rhizobium sp. AAP43]